MQAWGARQGRTGRLRCSWVPTLPHRKDLLPMADFFWSSTPMDRLAFGLKVLETSVVTKGLSFLPFSDAGLQVTGPGG